MEELASGELVLCPVWVVREAAAPARSKPGRAPAFQIAEGEHVVMPAREQRNAGRK